MSLIFGYLSAKPKPHSPAAASSSALGFSRASKGLGPDLAWPTSLHQNYKLGQLIGIGSYGVVFEAVQMNTGQRFAVKKIRKDSVAEDKNRVLARIAGEASLLEHMTHVLPEGVVQLIDKYEDAHAVYLVMELMQGGTLQDTLTSHGSMSERDACYIIQQCLAAVAAMHAANVVHGDIKPSNFLLNHSSEGPILLCNGSSEQWPEVKISDMGCSSSQDVDELVTAAVDPDDDPWFGSRDDASQIIVQGAMCGSTHYLAPEQLQGKKPLQSGDVYSIGIILLELLIPEHATLTSGLAQHDLEAAMALVHPHVSSQCAHLLRKLLCLDPEQRPTANEALQYDWFGSQLRCPVNF